MQNYFNTLSLREQLEQLGRCRFMATDEFTSGVSALKGKKIIILGCGAQGLNQGLNMRDSGLDIAYALRQEAIDQRRTSYQNATKNGFEVGTFEALIPKADVVCNLTPDKQHTAVINKVVPLMKQGVYAKHARGLMARYVIDHNIKNIDGLKAFNYADYNFSGELSNENDLVFTR